MAMNFDKLHKIVSFDQSFWLKKYVEQNSKKRAEATNDFKKHKGSSNSFFGETKEDVRNRIRVESVKNTDEKKSLYHQSRLDFNGIHKNYNDYVSNNFKENIVKMEKPMYLGFAFLELSKLLKYQTYYIKLQKYFGFNTIQLHYQDTDSFVISVKTTDSVEDMGKIQV